MPPTKAQPPQDNFQQPQASQAFQNNSQVPKPVNPAEQAKATMGIATMLQNHLLPKAPQKTETAPQQTEPDQGKEDQKLQQMMQMIAEEFKKQKAETAQMIQDAVGGLKQDIATALQEEDKNE